MTVKIATKSAEIVVSVLATVLLFPGIAVYLAIRFGNLSYSYDMLIIGKALVAIATIIAILMMLWLAVIRRRYVFYVATLLLMCGYPFAKLTQWYLI